MLKLRTLEWRTLEWRTLELKNSWFNNSSLDYWFLSIKNIYKFIVRRWSNQSLSPFLGSNFFFEGYNHDDKKYHGLLPPIEPLKSKKIPTIAMETQAHRNRHLRCTICLIYQWMQNYENPMIGQFSLEKCSPKFPKWSWINEIGSIYFMKQWKYIY